MKNILFVISLIIIVLISCRSGNKKSTNQSEKELFKQYKIVELWKTDTILMVPESVIYDEKRDVLYVSNLNYEPRLKDGNGFISRLNTNGEILNLRWIEGLSSPKGLAIVDDTLYTADVDELIVIDINKGQIIKNKRYHIRC
ncbi:MAG: hypothetical protein MUF36_03215 [Bacteroidales bacterium]|nr:hypothetical protein [Bacteroidales bacterium]